MPKLRNHFLIHCLKLLSYLLAIVLGMSTCTKDYPALVGYSAVSPPPPKPDTTTKNCPCPPPSHDSVRTPPAPVIPIDTIRVPVVPIDTLLVSAPRFSPDGGTFYMSTPVQLAADSLPPQAVIEYSVDNGKIWQTASHFTLKTGGTILTRIRSGTKLSPTRAAIFNLYFKRMLIIGNSIMNHGAAPSLGWYNTNGMAASEPDKDFVHLLTSYLQKLYPALVVELQSSGGFEQQFGTANYSIDEFDGMLERFKPDLIIVRMGENMDDTQVTNRDLRSQFRKLLERLESSASPVQIVCTTSVWYKPKADDVIRNVTVEKGHALVDLSSMIGQAQFFASQYQNPGVAAHPNDIGMRYIADMIWQKIQ